MPLLQDRDIDHALETLPGWVREGNALRRQFTFASFPDAVAFVNGLVPHAERADHHPDLTISYRRVTVLYSTHSEGGITEKDVDGARAANGEAEKVGHGHGPGGRG
jgi:4a-hydroxytetrahydrobiopterin dehydratase